MTRLFNVTRAVAVVAVGGALTGACSVDDPDYASATSLRPYYQQVLDWESCGENFECAELTVPLDYDRPGWKQITLAVGRRPASDPDARIGSLVINPGGPGGSGLNYARQAETVIAPEVRQRFDIVGFDPRGVGESTDVQCLPDEKLERFFALDASPDSSAERQQIVQASREYAQGCEQRSGTLLPHVGTANAARDMDVLRAALGDERLTYLGKSYGSELGAVYAEHFPNRVRALVLDGAINLKLSPREIGRTQAKGFETALRAFVADCVSRAKCPLGTEGVEDGIERLERLFDEIDVNPLPAGQGSRQLTQALAKSGLASALYDEQYWPMLRTSLELAFAGEGGGLLQLADALAGRRPDGTYSNLMEANAAISCIDAERPEKVSAYARAARKADRVAPHFGEFVAWSGLPCAFWPVEAAKQPKVDAAGADPILVVGTTRDPATPYAWAKALSRQLDSGVLLTRRGDGHTAYRMGNACIDKAVNRYLISTTPPKAGKVCG